MDNTSDPVRKMSGGGFLMLEDAWITYFSYDFETGWLGVDDSVRLVVVVA